MWSSLSVSSGDNSLVDILVKHPLLNGNYQDADAILKSSLRLPEQEDVVRQLPFPPTGEGWLKAYTGKNASTLVKQLKKSRRFQKSIKLEIDELVDTIRLIKEQEVKATLNAIGWADNRQDTIRALGLEDRDLGKCRGFTQNVR